MIFTSVFFVLCCVKLWVMSSFSPAVSSAQMFRRIVLGFFALPKRREGGGGGGGGGVEGGGRGEGWSLASRQRLCDMSICSFTTYFTSDYRLKISVKSFSFFFKGKTLRLYFNFPRLLKPVSMNQFESFFTVCLTLLSLNYTSDGNKRSSSCHFTATNTQQRTKVPPAFPAGKSIIKVPLR